ncbi:MAG: hypothetical protein R2807_02140 [Chitinophagales bacterium]
MSSKAPKSLGTEHVYSQWIPLFDSLNIPFADKMATAVEHIALQINRALEQYKNIRATTLFLTGGGALNTFLVERIQHRCSLKVIVPDVLTVQYKEPWQWHFWVVAYPRNPELLVFRNRCPKRCYWRCCLFTIIYNNFTT